MAKKLIPSQTVVICDVCKTVTDPYTYKAEALVTVKQHALGYQNEPVANGTYSLDCCDSCLDDINEFLTNLCLAKQTK